MTVPPTQRDFHQYLGPFLIIQEPEYLCPPGAVFSNAPFCACTILCVHHLLCFLHKRQIFDKMPNQWVSTGFISLNSYQKKKKTGIASKLKGRKDPCLASSRRDPLTQSWSCTLGHCLPSAAFLGLVVQAVGVVAADSSFGAGVDSCGVGSEVWDRGMGLARLRLGLGRQPYRFVHRTPVLYSRNQSRTNIALCKEKKGGRNGTACRVAQCGSGMGQTGSTQQLQECLPCYLPRCLLDLFVP